jgi:hypothetical protein
MNGVALRPAVRLAWSTKHLDTVNAVRINVTNQQG